MNKIILAIALATSLVTANVIYPATMVVVDTTDGITMETYSGMIYAVDDDPEDIYLGDVLSVLMLDPGTPDDATDDIVIDYQYAGWTLF